jgi:hypothetical protein
LEAFAVPEFHSEQLSPRRRAQPVECELPYFLTWENLRPCLVDLDESRASESRAFRAFEKQGKFQGTTNSCILTLRFPTRARRWSETTVFVKDIANPQDVESDNYAFLAHVGVPTPRLLTTVARQIGEVIVTEFLSRIGIDVGSLIEVTELLALLARLNAVRTPPGAFVSRPGTPRERMDALRKAGLARLALDPRARVDVDRWFEAFAAARETVPRMPLALTHNEFSFQQAGWARRGHDSALVIFDLATMGHHPRFADLTSILPVVATGTSYMEIELLDIYLGFLQDFTGVKIDVVEAMQELRLFRIYGQFSALYWLTHDVYEPCSDELLDVAQQLHADMVGAGLIDPSS